MQQAATTTLRQAITIVIVLGVLLCRLLGQSSGQWVAGIIMPTAHRRGPLAPHLFAGVILVIARALIGTMMGSPANDLILCCGLARLHLANGP